MSEQRTDLDYTDSQKKVLELEKKYMTRLIEIFTSKNFMKNINDSINNTKKLVEQGSLDFWDQTNPFALTFERIIHFTIYQELKSEILKPYPSPISSDIGVILGDAVLNIDAKSNGLASNKDDIKQLQLSNNQLSFTTKPVNGNIWEYKSYQPCYFDDKPNLTFFLNFAYNTNEKKSFEGFDLINPNNDHRKKHRYKDLVLISVPNAQLSNLFEYNIAYGFKTYNKINELLTIKNQSEKEIVNSNNKIEIDQYIKNKLPDLYKEKKDLVTEHNVIAMKTPTAVFISKDEKRYKFKVKKDTDKTIVFQEVEPSTARIKFDTLENRFDHNKEAWKGVYKFDVR